MGSAETHNQSREAVLARIRAALKAQAVRPEPATHSPVFPPVGKDLLATFHAACAANLMELVVTRSWDETAGALRAALTSVPTGEVFVEDAPELRQSVDSLETPVRWSSKGIPQENAVATITGCEALVAATGTILVASERGGRGGSVVAPCHIVVARESQLVPDLEAAFAHLRAESIAERNSFVGFITGCSRTADIEKIIVIGAHGPRRVVVILQMDS